MVRLGVETLEQRSLLSATIFQPAPFDPLQAELPEGRAGAIVEDGGPVGVVVPNLTSSEPPFVRDLPPSEPALPPDTRRGVPVQSDLMVQVVSLPEAAAQSEGTAAVEEVALPAAASGAPREDILRYEPPAERLPLRATPLDPLVLAAEEQKIEDAAAEGASDSRILPESADTISEPALPVSGLEPAAVDRIQETLGQEDGTISIEPLLYAAVPQPEQPHAQFSFAAPEVLPTDVPAAPAAETTSAAPANASSRQALYALDALYAASRADRDPFAELHSPVARPFFEQLQDGMLDGKRSRRLV